MRCLLSIVLSATYVVSRKPRAASRSHPLWPTKEMTTVVDDVASVSTWLRHSASGRGQSAAMAPIRPSPHHRRLPTPASVVVALPDVPCAIRGAVLGPLALRSPTCALPSTYPRVRQGTIVGGCNTDASCAQRHDHRPLSCADRRPPSRPLPVVGNQLSGSFPPSSPGHFWQASKPPAADRLERQSTTGSGCR
jgi:hypothetical protein